jgi:glycosyltransferase involved in cell wall biosynthesis
MPETRRWLVHGVLRLLLRVYSVALALARRLGGPRRAPDASGVDVLLTATFHSDNWIAAHLAPMVSADRCRRVVMVSTRPVPPLPKVDVVMPPRWLQRTLGEVPARLLAFAVAGLARRPQFVGGFHLLLNGLCAGLLAPLVGARSLYFSVGGAAEVEGGGIRSENRLFSKLSGPDPVIERLLIAAVRQIDVVITMGSGAAEFFERHAVAGEIRVVGGGIDGARFRPPEQEPETDVILVGRLVPLKRVDLFLDALATVVARRPQTRAVVVGDGALRPQLEAQARALRLEAHVEFAGARTDVEAFLRRARLVVLTSDTEGVPLSIMEAMMCGLPAVVSDVGDLADIVEQGVNGYRVVERTPQAFAARILELLDEPEKRARFSLAARERAGRQEIRRVAQAWDAILSGTAQ